MINKGTLKSNMEVCQEQTKKGYYLFCLKEKKVKYIVKEKNVLSLEKLGDIFALFNKEEQKLQSPLPFKVNLNTSLMFAFKNYFKIDEIAKICDIMQDKIFFLLNDITLRRTLRSSRKIADEYLYTSKLEKLKQYYDKYENIVLNSFSKGYSSLFLFEVIYENLQVSPILGNIYKAAKSETVDGKEKTLACNLIINFENEILDAHSENSREYIYYHISKINSVFKELDISKLNPFNFSEIIDFYYSLTEKKSVMA